MGITSHFRHLLSPRSHRTYRALSYSAAYPPAHPQYAYTYKLPATSEGDSVTLTTYTDKKLSKSEQQALRRDLQANQTRIRHVANAQIAQANAQMNAARAMAEQARMDMETGMDQMRREMESLFPSAKPLYRPAALERQRERSNTHARSSFSFNLNEAMGDLVTSKTFPHAVYVKSAFYDSGMTKVYIYKSRDAFKKGAKPIATWRFPYPVSISSSSKNYNGKQKGEVKVYKPANPESKVYKRYADEVSASSTEDGNYFRFPFGEFPPFPPMPAFPFIFE